MKLLEKVGCWIPFAIEPTSHHYCIIQNGKLIQTPQTSKLTYQTSGRELLLILPKGEILEDPIYLIYLTTESIHYKTQIVVEEAARATIIECYFQPVSEAAKVKAETEILLKSAAALEHTLWIAADPNRQTTTDISTDTQVEQAEKSYYHSFFTASGCEQHCSNLQISLRGKQAQAETFALFLPKRSEQSKLFYLVQHLQAECRSQLLARSVVDEYAKFNFSGKIKVSKGAHQSVARLENKNILLDKNAEVQTQPELEIYHDDLHCSHGATTGYLDEEALFYLKSRGIPENQAKQILVKGFIQPLIQAIPLSGLQTYLERSSNEPL